MYENYPFEPEFQHKILARIMQHPAKFMGRAGTLNAAYFTGIHPMVTARVLFNHWRKHSRFPDWPILRRAIHEAIARTSEEKDGEQISDYLDRLRDMDTDDADLVADRITQWVKNRATYLFLDDLAAIFTEGKPLNPLKAIKDIEEITRIGFDENLTRNALQLARAMIDPNDTLLGDRFLCKEGGMLFAASTGAGKSVASNQMAVAWSCGREALGIKPARPLKIMVVQAEDDAGDQAEMLLGVIEGLELTDEELELVQQNTVYERECTRCGDDFIVWLNEHIYHHRPDLVIINPLNSYIGGKGVLDAGTVTKFLRNGINSILMRYRCAALIVHHTPKTNNKERDVQKWRPSDWVYTYAGVNEIGNWARAALAIEATHDPLVFKFIAAKRGRRIGWQNDFLEPELIRYFKQSTGKLYWAEATDSDIDQAEAANEAAKKSGRPKGVADTALLKPLKEAFTSGRGLTQAEWLEALEEVHVVISQSTLSRRARVLKRAGKVRQEKDLWWLVESKKCAS